MYLVYLTMIGHLLEYLPQEEMLKCIDLQTTSNNLWHIRLRFVHTLPWQTKCKM